MQHCSGEIEDRTQVRSRIGRKFGQRHAGDGVRLAWLDPAGAQSRSRCVQRLTNRHDRRGPAEPSDGKRCRFGLEDIIDRRQCAQSVIGFGRHCGPFQ